MIKNIKKHFWHYFIYLITFGGGLVLIALAQGNATMQAQLIFLIAALYFIWAMVHHYVHHDLTARVAIEYMLVIALGTLLLLFLFGV
jgi:hypothetical protein